MSRPTENKRKLTKIIGTSKPIIEVLDRVETVAPSDTKVLIVGESGTGKELVARAIHMSSPICNKPFIVLNCGAVTETILESVLFGHDKGAFTSAVAARDGRFKMADGGTLFLDEVGELSLGSQVRLLRVLQEQEFERVGGNQTIKVDVRIVAATNRNLEQMITKGMFREDLYYRLNVIRIEIPPLRARKEDIPLLLDHFIATYSNRNGKNKISGISDDALNVLMQYSFPGNIRELDNIIQAAIIFAKGQEITVDDLREKISIRQRQTGSDDSNCNIKKEDLLKALKDAVITTKSGKKTIWYKNMRAANIYTIYKFLLKSDFDTFCRSEFAVFMLDKASDKRSKYKTAGEYLKILKQNNICEHNGKKSNQSRHFLSEGFVLDE